MTAQKCPLRVTSGGRDEHGPESGLPLSDDMTKASGSGIVEVGACDHLNAASGLEDWPQGKSLLTAFAAGACC